MDRAGGWLCGGPVFVEIPIADSSGLTTWAQVRLGGRSGGHDVDGLRYVNC